MHIILQWCESYGVHLAEVNDQAENDFLKRLVLSITRRGARTMPHWIGLDGFSSTDGGYTWTISGGLVQNTYVPP